MITLFHAGNDDARTARLLRARFNESDQEQLREWTAPAVWVSSTVYPWVSLHPDGRRKAMRHVLQLDVDMSRQELAIYEDGEFQNASGGHFIPFEVLNQRISAVRELVPETFDEAFWASWQEWYDVRAATLAGLDEED